MKIEISKGTKLEDALTFLQDWFRENASEYGILKNKMNIYVTLQSEEKNICPLNEKSFMVSNNEMIDKNMHAEEVAIEYAESHYLFPYLQKMKKDIETIPSDIEKAEKNYDKAKKNGFSTVSKWESELKDLREKEKLIPARTEKYNQLEKLINEHTYTWQLALIRDRYDIDYIDIRCIIDENCTIWEKPLYLYYNGFSYEDKPRMYWISAKRGRQ